MPDGAASGQRAATDIVVVLGTFLVAGAVAGVLWPQLVEPVTVTRNEFGLVIDEVGLARRFNNDGWYALLGGAGGLLLGTVLTLWRNAHEVVTVLVVTAGAMVAALVSARVGTWLGPDAPEQVLEGAPQGATAAAQVQLASSAAYLVWPVAALTGAVVVLWTSTRFDRDPTRRGRQSFRGR